MMLKENSLNWMSAGLMVLMLGLFTGSAMGAVDMFIKIDDIKGESQDSAHPDWIDIESFSQGVSREIGQVTSGAGKAAISQRSDFLVTKYVDKSTPNLMKSCCQGTFIPTVTLELVNTAGGNKRPYMVYKLHNVQVSSCLVAGDTGAGAQPIEEITLNYESIEWTYTEFDALNRPTQTHKSSWDFVRNVIR